MDDRGAWMRENLRRLLHDADTRTRRQEVEEDIATSRGLTPADCDRRLQAVVLAARHIRVARDNPNDLLEVEAPSGDFQEMWSRAVRRRNLRAVG